MAAVPEPMRLALAEGRRALGWSSPNPAVGAVVVAPSGRTVGAGRTQPPGGDHAEVAALREAGERARGATVWVTLEPCAHRGRTPPCTEALIEAGVAAVRYAIADPDPRVSGAGRRRLAEAGVAVAAGDGAEEAAAQLEGYLHQRRTGRPFVIAKYAASLDGRIAAASGDSRWVSGPETRAWAHDRRQGLDAIVVGSGTVLADDPQLTARPEGVGRPHQPLRVVADSRGRTPERARVLGGPGAALIATTAAAPAAWRARMEARGAELLVLPAGGGGRVDLAALIGALGGRGALSVLFEGGGVLLGSLFDRRLVDRVQAIVAPIVIGAAAAPAAVAGRGARRMADAPRLREVAVTRLGEDTLISGLPIWPSGE